MVREERPEAIDGEELAGLVLFAQQELTEDPSGERALVVERRHFEHVLCCALAVDVIRVDRGGIDAEEPAERAADLELPPRLVGQAAYEEFR